MLALGFSALLSSVDVFACAACGDTLSKDWESQGISGRHGFIADLSYDYLNQNKQRYGTSAASTSLINSQYVQWTGSRGLHQDEYDFGFIDL